MSFNLLPASEQKNIRVLKMLWGLQEFCLILVITLGVISLLLMAGNSVLTNASSDLVTVLTTTQTSRQGLQEKITTLNQRIQTALKIQNEWLPVHAYIETATTPVHDRITLTNLTFLNREGTLTIHGFAKTRKDFLAYQEVLSKSGFFEQIHSPLSNILEPMDITFQLTATIKGLGASPKSILPSSPPLLTPIEQ